MPTRIILASGQSLDLANTLDEVDEIIADKTKSPRFKTVDGKKALIRRVRIDVAVEL